MRIVLFTFLSIIFSTASSYAATTDFVFTVTMPSAGSTFTIPTIGSGYSYQVDWTNSGIPDATVQTGSATHTYSSAGTFTIRVSGTFPRIYFNGGGDAQNVASIVQWGTAMNWTSFQSAFNGCSYMVVSATDVPILTGVTSLNSMFDWCSYFNAGNLSAWDVHAITDMSNMFNGCIRFNENIGNWNTAAVTDMSYMFSNARAFNQPLTSFNTAAVTNMSSMFNGARAFNQSLSSFNTAAVTNMSSMFNGALAFNQSLSSFNTANVSNMTYMFYNAKAFNQSLSSFNTTAVTDMSYMFYNAYIFNQSLSSFNTANVSNMTYMFNNARAFNQSLSSFNTTAVTNMNSMFSNAFRFNQSVSSFNTANVTNMSQMFNYASSFNQPLSSFNTAAITDMSSMFFNASAFNQSLNNFNTAAVTNMYGMFGSAKAFNQSLSSFNTTYVTIMSWMFYSASAFNQSLSSFNTAAVTDMSYMFQNASAFNQPLGSFNTAAITDMSYMFQNASAFNQNIGSWNIGQVTNMTAMLGNSGMGVANYDLTLIGWQASAHPSNITLGSTNLKYCASSAQHAALVANGWIINDSYLYASTVPTLVATNSFVATANVTCTDANGYQQFINSLTLPTAKYMAINPNSNIGYSFAVTSANNSPTVANQRKTDGSSNTTALANRMYTVVDAGTNSYPTGMTVRIYYDPADTAAAVAALDAAVTGPVTSQWFKMSGTDHNANVAAILANQNFKGINGATFLVPSSYGTEGSVNYVEFSGITSFSTFGYLAGKTASSLLPVTLASFKATANRCSADLDWHSATESNSSYYAIEESSDGSTFNQVAKLKSGNSTSGAAYTYAYPLQSGTNYFRLKMVDLDGRFSYSPIVVVMGTGLCGTGVQATVSPNPTSNLLNIAGLAIGSTATLYDMDGKKIKTILATATTGTISMQALVKGVYMLQVQQSSGTLKTLKVVKQ